MTSHATTVPGPTPVTRHVVIEALRGGLQRHEFVRAATLGGSDATGRADERSDVDLFLIVEPGAIERAAALVEEILKSVSPIRVRYRMPMPSWHGFHQAFYQLRDASEDLMVDWVIVEVGTPHPWFEVERHGTHKVLFDRDGAVRVAHVDRAVLDVAIGKKREEIRAKFALFRHLPGKLVDRGSEPDAAYFYHALVLRPVVDLLRMKHAPERHDYGFRYLKHDLPREEYERVRRWCYPRTPEEITVFSAEISECVGQLLADEAGA